MTTSDTIKELQELRRGRGLAADDLHKRIGPRLRQACDVGESDPPAQVRRKVTLKLTELCGRLDDDRRLAARVAFALHPEAAGKTLDQRVSWLAVHFDRDPKTAIRRIDSAFRMIAEEIDNQSETDNEYVPEGWYVESLRSVLRMDLPVPLLTEERRIVATVDELDEITLSLGAPKPFDASSEDRIAAEMIYGGEIVEQDHTNATYARFVVRLPQPLRLGQSHEYSVSFTSYPRDLMRPYYVITPSRRCEHFFLRVRFGTEGRPALLWRLNGVPMRVVDEFQANSDTWPIDRVGDVALEFHGLKQGLSYGLQWKV